MTTIAAAFRQKRAAVLERRTLTRTFVIATAAGVFLALVGPFGTSGAALLQRLVYWMVLTEGGTVLGLAASAGVCALADPEGRRPYVAAGLTAAAITAPGTVLVFAVTRWMFGPGGGLIDFAPPVLILSLALSAINTLANRTPAHTHAAKVGAPPSRFTERLPPKLRGAQIYAVEAEDHYLRLHTSKGSDLILMRLSDAIAELEGVEGAQTHRSWWVARGAVQGAKRADGRAVLALPGGVEAPVSRSFARALRAEGWF